MSVPLRGFKWDAIPTTVTDEDTQTYDAGALQKKYTVPAGQIWHICSWRGTPSAAKTYTVRLYKEAALTNVAEEWFSGTATAARYYSSRGQGVANNYGWTEIDIPAGATIAFDFAADGAGQTLKTQISYKARAA